MATQPRTLEYLPLDEIVVADWNPKVHQAELIQDSVAEHGFVTPLVLDDRNGKLVAGHGRRDELLRARAAGEDPPMWRAAGSKLPPGSCRCWSAPGNPDRSDLPRSEPRCSVVGTPTS